MCLAVTELVSDTPLSPTGLRQKSGQTSAARITLWAVCRGEEEPTDRRILIPVDPWSSSSTGDEDWEVNYDYPQDELWEVTPE